MLIIEWSGRTRGRFGISRSLRGIKSLFSGVKPPRRRCSGGRRARSNEGRSNRGGFVEGWNESRENCLFPFSRCSPVTSSLGIFTFLLEPLTIGRRLGQAVASLCSSRRINRTWGKRPPLSLSRTVNRKEGGELAGGEQRK